MFGLHSINVQSREIEKKAGSQEQAHARSEP